MRLSAAFLVPVLAVAGAWLGVGSPPSPAGLAAPESAAQGVRETLAAELADANERTHLAEPASITEPATPGPRGACVEELTLAGLVLDERAQDADFERAFAAFPRAERVLARHRIRKLFAVGQEDARAFRALVPGSGEVDLLARQLTWLTANLSAEPADPLAALGVARVRDGANPDSIARHYAGVCDEELALEHDALLRALAVENERALDERIAAGQYRVRQQSAYG